MHRSRLVLLSAAAAIAVAATAAWVATPASAAPPTASFSKVSEWPSGWEARYTISNSGSANLSSWKVEFDLPAGTTITGHWEANRATSGLHTTFTNVGWNGSLAPGGSVTFGFLGSGPGSPSNCRLNGQPCGGEVDTKPSPSAPVPSPSASPSQPDPRPSPSTPGPSPSVGDPLPHPGDQLPLTITNNSGRGEQIHLYVLGESLVAPHRGRLGYVNAAGTFIPWTGGTKVPSPAPDVSIAGPAQGASTTVKVPRGLSGRVYMSFGEKLKFGLSLDGLVQPAPWAGGDANKDILFDWSEFTFNEGGLWLNSSQVDMFAVPHAVTVTGGDRVTKKTGELFPNGREKVFSSLVNAGGDWGKLIHTRADGTRLRALAPGKGLDAGTFDRNYLAGYVTSAWNAYRNTQLTVVPFQHEPNKKFFGRTDASGNVMNFTDTTGKQVASFEKPSTAAVFGCDGQLAAPNDHVKGPIARTLCAALQRSTLGSSAQEPVTNGGAFYQGAITNHYSRIVHQNMVDGKAYGFAFDDVGAFESLVHDGDPRAAGIILTPF